MMGDPWQERVKQEGAFIVDDRPAAPMLICGGCGSDDLTGMAVSVAGGVAMTRVVCGHCGASYYVVGMVRADE